MEAFSIACSTPEMSGGREEGRGGGRGRKRKWRHSLGWNEHFP